jgi:hypothetical protein
MKKTEEATNLNGKAFSFGIFWNLRMAAASRFYR